MIGVRFERLQEKVLLLTQQQRATEAVFIQDATRKQTEETHKQTRTITHLQEVTDMGFWGVLFPYYLYNLFHHVIVEWKMPEHIQRIDETVLCLSILLGAAYIAYRKLVAPRPINTSRKLLLVALLVSTVIIATLALVALVPQPVEAKQPLLWLPSVAVDYKPANEIDLKQFQKPSPQPAPKARRPHRGRARRYTQ